MPVDSSRKEANKHQSGVRALIKASPDVSIQDGGIILKIPSDMG